MKRLTALLAALALAVLLLPAAASAWTNTAQRYSGLLWSPQASCPTWAPCQPPPPNSVDTNYCGQTDTNIITRKCAVDYGASYDTEGHTDCVNALRYNGDGDNCIFAAQNAQTATYNGGASWLVYYMYYHVRKVGNAEPQLYCLDSVYVGGTSAHPFLYTSSHHRIGCWYY